MGRVTNLNLTQQFNHPLEFIDSKTRVIYRNRAIRNSLITICIVILAAMLLTFLDARGLLGVPSYSRRSGSGNIIADILSFAAMLLPI